jgi:hypothetical protein
VIKRTRKVTTISYINLQLYTWQIGEQEPQSAAFLCGITEAVRPNASQSAAPE